MAVDPDLTGPALDDAGLAGPDVTDTGFTDPNAGDAAVAVAAPAPSAATATPTAVILRTVVFTNPPVHEPPSRGQEADTVHPRLLSVTTLGPGLNPVDLEVGL